MTNKFGQKILVVEDSLDISELIEQILANEGYNIVCLSNGIEALEYLNSCQELPVLILLDLMMPDMDGIEFRRLQQNLQRASHIPVIVMSADGQLKKKFSNLGITGFLKKPFTDIETIVVTVKKTIEK